MNLVVTVLGLLVGLDRGEVDLAQALDEGLHLGGALAGAGFIEAVRRVDRARAEARLQPLEPHAARDFVFFAFEVELGLELLEAVFLTAQVLQLEFLAGGAFAQFEVLGQQAFAFGQALLEACRDFGLPGMGFFKLGREAGMRGRQLGQTLAVAGQLGRAALEFFL
ncbi:MAG: hypothetical protein BWY87_01445 [Deltaproteobacteria bacterium ADurb.Bin510]|nr:MAG: hypothetical protein BWY87_01445 [Deltaproteobacteria bacterium ADurb.Bin510]